MNNAVAPTAGAVHKVLPVGAFFESSTNPRKTFDKALLAELAESIKTHGVVQPILARPKPGADGEFEIVFGARRHRAAKIALLDEIPALIREMTDTEAVEIQCIENLQREDLLPLEEAEGYEKLIKSHGYNAQSIADKIGKSKSYVDKRLKLCDLGPAGREAFQRGDLSITTALMVARIPQPDLQRKAVGDIGRSSWAGPMSANEASEHIQRNYMLRLEQAPFDTADIALLPAAGSCAACPKRTGNQPELFADVKKGDLCTDPKCFQEKRTAHRVMILEKAKASGQTVVTGAEARKAKPHQYGGINGFVTAKDVVHVDPKGRTVGQLLGKEAPAAILFEDPHTKDVSEVFDGKEVELLIRTKHPKLIVERPRATTSSNSDTGALRAAERKAKVEREIRVAIMAEIKAKLTGKLFDRPEFMLVAVAFYGRLDYDRQKRVCDLWGWQDAFKQNRDGPTKKIEALNLGDLQRFLMDCSLVHEVVPHLHSTSKPSGLYAMAKRHKVDADKIRRELTADAKGKAKKPKAKPGSLGASFMKPRKPKPALAAIVGAAELTRIEVTKKIWSYIKKHGLQDKQNKRMINADEKLKAALGGRARVSMFEMTKVLNEQLN